MGWYFKKPKVEKFKVTLMFSLNYGSVLQAEEDRVLFFTATRGC